MSRPGHHYPLPMSTKDRIIAAMDHPASLPGDPALRWHEWRDVDGSLDDMAATVAGLPPMLTIGQRQRLAVIAKELQRRSR